MSLFLAPYSGFVIPHPNWTFWATQLTYIRGFYAYEGR